MTEAIKDLPALVPAERAAVVLQSAKAAAELTALVESSQSITAITSPDGRTECHAAAMKARAARVGIEKAGKDARDDATAFSKAVIAEQARLVAIIEPEQDRLLVLRDEWDAKIEAEKAAKVEAERLRVAGIMARIDELRDTALRAVGKDAAALTMMIDTLADWPIDEPFEEFANEAKGVKRAALAQLTEIHAAVKEAEEFAARVAEEKRLADLMAVQELADLEAEAARQREENERIRIANEAATAKLKAERDAFEKQQAEAKAEADRLAAEAKATQDRLAGEAFEAAKIPASTPTPCPATTVSPPTYCADQSLAVSFDTMMAATVAPVLGGPKSHRNALIDEIEGSLADMPTPELQQVAHFIDRLQSLRKAA